MAEFIRRHFLKLLGAILVSAVGSSLWEILLKPVTIWLSGFLMTLGTMGIPMLRDKVYIEIAKGLHEDPSITLVAMALGALGVTLFILVRGIMTKTPGHADFEAVSPEPPGHPIERTWQRKAEPNANLRGPLGSAIWANVILLFLCTILLSRLFYINRAIVYFRQSFEAATPYLSEQEEEEILGDFSSMQGIPDFVAVTARVEHVAHTHGKRTPEFTIW